ncbi:hypothetical protein HPB51_017292 [Rhipicephalus microplus]|uniref:DIX domain-containing protein n=1 Tax=Rhipicephalus microplus TaxID=6941 RepID=A0A9J6EUL3_RHIMP|nr:hypothetical protein HPB51_017292 [Rhipicephalus microplus]
MGELKSFPLTKYEQVFIVFLETIEHFFFDLFPRLIILEDVVKSPLAQSVICHYGSNEETVVALPPDGVCDYTFCEQFYTRSHKGFLEGMTADQATFMESAGRHTRTEYGISFPVVALGAVHLDLSKEAAASSVSRYWGMRFYHYGFVTMELGRSYKELTHVLEVLKMVKKLVTPLTWRQDRPSYTAIGWNEKDTSMVKDAVRTMKTTLMPDFIIVHGHRVYAGSNPSPERVSAPTNMFVDKDTSAIVQTLGQAIQSLKALSRTRITAALALSVSMSAFGYNLKNADLPDGTGAMFQEANDSSVPPFTEYRHGLVGGAGRQAAPGGEIITPHRFRSFISKKGNHRFFRRSCQEFGTDVVSEEMPDDNEVLSLGGQDPCHAHFGDNNSSNYQLRFPTEKAWQNSADKAPHSPLNSQEFRVDPRKHCIWLRPGRRDGSWIRVAAQPSSRRNDCSIPPLPPVVMGWSLDRRRQQVVLVCGYPGDYFYSRERYNYSYNFRYRYQDGRILLWDTEGSLREKMCRLKRNYTKVPYSLAAYDLDWDDEEDTCAFANWFGAYSRVKMVRVLSDFFHDGFSRAHDEADCLVIGDEF